MFLSLNSSRPAGTCLVIIRFCCWSIEHRRRRQRRGPLVVCLSFGKEIMMDTHRSAEYSLVVMMTDVETGSKNCPWIRVVAGRQVLYKGTGSFCQPSFTSFELFLGVSSVLHSCKPIEIDYNFSIASKLFLANERTTENLQKKWHN